MAGFLGDGKEPIFARNEMDLGRKGFKTHCRCILKSNLLSTSLSSVLKKEEGFYSAYRKCSFSPFVWQSHQHTCQSLVR